MFLEPFCSSFFSIEERALQAVLRDPMVFLQATDRRFLSSTVRSALAATTLFIASNISSNLSVCSVILAIQRCSSRVLAVIFVLIQIKYKTSTKFSDLKNHSQYITIEILVFRNSHLKKQKLQFRHGLWLISLQCYQYSYIYLFYIFVVVNFSKREVSGVGQVVLDFLKIINCKIELNKNKKIQKLLFLQIISITYHSLLQSIKKKKFSKT